MRILINYLEKENAIVTTPLYCTESSQFFRRIAIFGMTFLDFHRPIYANIKEKKNI